MINCKDESTFEWIKHCVLATACVDNPNAHPNNIICTIKNTKLFIPIVTLSEKYNPKLSKPLSKGFERSVSWN